jgi:hypothetical protein
MQYTRLASRPTRVMALASIAVLLISMSTYAIVNCGEYILDCQLCNRDYLIVFGGCFCDDGGTCGTIRNGNCYTSAACSCQYPNGTVKVQVIACSGQPGYVPVCGALTPAPNETTRAVSYLAGIGTQRRQAK